jgi:hypothetical protein
MKRRDCLALLGASSLLLAGCASTGPAPSLVGTGDLGVVVARSTGTLAIVNTSQRACWGAGRRAWATCRTPRWCSRATARAPTCSAATAR